MTRLEEGNRDEEKGSGLGAPIGSRHHRAFVGPPEDYDLIAAMSFNLLTTLGLRQHHRLLDIGCGSLRLGRLFIPYLNLGNFTGIEPARWLVEQGVEFEIGKDLVDIKKPQFVFAEDPEALGECQPFDFAIAQSVFSHCSKEQIGNWLRGVSARLKPDGAFVATFLIGERDSDGNSWSYPECVAYRFTTLQELAARSGMVLVPLDWDHPRQTWGLFAKPDFDVSWFEHRALSWTTSVRVGPLRALSALKNHL